MENNRFLDSAKAEPRMVVCHDGCVRFYIRPDTKKAHSKWMENGCEMVKKHFNRPEDCPSKDNCQCKLVFAPERTSEFRVMNENQRVAPYDLMIDGAAPDGIIDDYEAFKEREYKRKEERKNRPVEQEPCVVPPTVDDRRKFLYEMVRTIPIYKLQIIADRVQLTGFVKIDGINDRDFARAYVDWLVNIHDVNKTIFERELSDILDLMYIKYIVEFGNRLNIPKIYSANRNNVSKFAYKLKQSIMNW